ncbi:GNAT family N-acetyltransferase [Mycobacterium shigaense]|uniref:N-acetyltransferase Eis n=1 Tax=Mycobacterium shigaense TaxID=722731 RepID=A0A1Z4EKQ6_9MYCO|nr:GNAT family N-acetyltransferase [Mycobacterium shigaense]MEA1123391.1 GNAT family N-acetyltransferase [Mycobacterium shigaense]PRI15811.1 GNAT family N-acetyltransferase [Mycobacterium shigaense]BAX93549.1 enhanced intracellular survival protein [Mycobacterium shigaense]
MPQSHSVNPDQLPAGLTVRSPTDDDWSAMYLLGAASFSNFIAAEVAAWRALIPADGAVVICDGSQVVGMALCLDLRVTVPGSAVLPMAGLSFVAVAPTHRRRGLLRAMCAELHRRIAVSGYPLAGLYASEGGIYGRFGYGPATIAHEFTVERRFAEFHADVPHIGGVRLVRPAERRGELVAIHDRWCQRVPGGLARPPVLWDLLLAEPKAFGLLHPDGYALYQMDDADARVVRVVEFRALTTDAHVALWRVLLGLDKKEKVVITTHPDDALPYLLTDHRVARTTGRQDAVWLRIIDVAAVLEARTYGADLSAVLEVSGSGRFALQIRDGHARCTPTDETADVEMGIDVLGSLYLGAHRASTLAAANRLRTKDSRLLRCLDTAFATDVPAASGMEF